MINSCSLCDLYTKSANYFANIDSKLF